MSSLAIRILPEPVRSLGFASIGVGYTGIGTAISNPGRLLLFQNLTDATVMISWDGVNDHFPLAAQSVFILDITSNRTDTSGIFNVAEGTRFYVKEVGVPSLGSVYVTNFYGFGLL